MRKILRNSHFKFLYIKLSKSFSHRYSKIFSDLCKRICPQINANYSNRYYQKNVSLLYVKELILFCFQI